MTSLSNVWNEQEKLRLQEWPELYLRSLAIPLLDDGRGEITTDQVIQSAFDAGFEVVHWSRLAMFDWDLAKESGPINVRYLHQEELPELRQRVANLINAGWGLRLYKTPGGLRAFITSRTVTLEEWIDLANYLHVDILYMQILVRRWPGKQTGWACRVGPKPGREGDYVARLLGQYGEISEDLQPYISLHDHLIARHH